MIRIHPFPCLLLLAAGAGAALAEPPVVAGASATPSAGSWQFEVTLIHPDTGWDHYADGWRVETEDGTVLGLRELVHPHVEEQPFTRSLSGVEIPDGVTEVHVRARCLVTGWSEERTAVPLDAGAQASP